MKYKLETGNETDLVHKLEVYKLDMVIGGFEKKSVWKKKVAVTKPYDSNHVFFVPKGENRLLYEVEKFNIRQWKKAE